MGKQYTKVVDWTSMPRIWWIPGDDVWYSEARQEGDAPYERVDTGEPMFWLPPDRAELKQVHVDNSRNPHPWTGDDIRKWAEGMAAAVERGEATVGVDMVSNAGRKVWMFVSRKRETDER